MKKYNYHTHTYRCKHAFGTDEEYVLAAIEAGYEILGFSDHAPYHDFPSENSHMDWEQLDDYIQSINYLKEKYKDQIEIHLGLETEYYEFNHDERKQLSEMVDYLILGQHYSSPGNDHINYFKKNTDEEIMEYASSVCKALNTGMFMYLCHPDVYMNRQDEFNETCKEAAHMICKKIVEVGIPMEVNIHGAMKGKHSFRDGDRFYYPHKEFWKIASKYPVKCVIGIDAHHPNDFLAAHFVRQAKDELKEFNLNYINEPLI